MNRRVSNTRCGETMELKRVTGRFCGRSSTSPAAASTAGAALRSARVSGPASRNDAVTLCARPRQTMGSNPGGGSGNQGAGGATAGGVALRSFSSMVISLPCSTSMAAWCVLVSKAKLPLGRSRKPSRPSMT